MKIPYDFMLFCCNEYFNQLNNVYILTSKTMTACTMCALAYDMIERGEY